MIQNFRSPNSLLQMIQLLQRELIIQVIYSNKKIRLRPSPQADF
jgi:hypothetical protein